MRDEQLVKFARRWSTAIGLTIQYIITGLFSRLFTIVVGGFFGVNVYRIFQAEIGWHLLSVTMAVIAAFGVEAVGFMATHRAVKTYEQGKPMLIPLLFVAVYLLVSIGALMFADVSLAYRFVSIGIVVLIGINYALIGMETLERKESAVERKAAARVDTLEDGQIEFERELKRHQAADRLAVKMAKISATPSATPSANSAPAPILPSNTLSTEMVSRLTEVYEAFAEGDIITTAEAGAVVGKSSRTMQKVMMAGVDAGVFNNPKRGQYIKNGVNPNEL